MLSVGADDLTCKALPCRAQTPPRGEVEQVRTQRPFVGTRFLAFVAFAGAFQSHAACVIADLADRFDILGGQALLRQGGEIVELALNGACAFAVFLNEGVESMQKAR